MIPLHFMRFMLCFGIIFQNDECDEKEIDETLARKIFKYASVFVDLSVYYPDISFEFSDIETALASVICARKHYKIYPNFNSRLLDLYASESSDSSRVQEASERLWEKYELVRG